MSDSDRLLVSLGILPGLSDGQVEHLPDAKPDTDVDSYSLVLPNLGYTGLGACLTTSAYLVWKYRSLLTNLIRARFTLCLRTRVESEIDHRTTGGSLQRNVVVIEFDAQESLNIMANERSENPLLYPSPPPALDEVGSLPTVHDHRRSMTSRSSGATLDFRELQID